MLKQIVKTNLCKSLIRTSLAKKNFCENYLRYKITVPKRYVTYIDINILLLLSVCYYKPFVTKCYIRVSEIEKNIFSVT